MIFSSDRVLSSSSLEQLFRAFALDKPDPRGELYYTNGYTLLIAVVLSAQATDKGVNRATKVLFAKVTSPQEMLAFGIEELREHIKSIGLFKTKARHIMALSHLLLERHGGVVPRSRSALEALPGVGRKTANVVLNILFDEPRIAVDTHIFRVANRMGIAQGKTPLEVEKGLEQRVPDWAKKRCHHWLILHGRYTCLARKPLCLKCFVRSYCLWQNKVMEPS